jgi:GT2 family glycosyltransferase/peptidoglycan/xylan/chitin deacetylase (PgdA/CDA1 family)
VRTVVPVLLYHSVSDIRTADEFTVSRARFREHVAAVTASGRVPLTVGELAEGLRGDAPLPQRPVVITFDDGFRDTLAATDLLCGAGLRATVYVTTGALAEGDRISAEQVRTLGANPDGVELGAHTVSHPRLDEILVDAARREITDSKAALEDLVGRTVETFAYPHGAYDARCRQLVVDAGFRSAAAVKNALSHSGDDPWAIARWTVTGNTSAQQIAEVLEGRSAPVAWAQERLRTRAYRIYRRARRRAARAEPRQTVNVSPPGELTTSPVVQAADAPIAVIAVDVTGELTDVELGQPRFADAYRKVAILARAGDQPLGWTTVVAPPSGRLSGVVLEQALAGHPAVRSARSSDSSERPNRDISLQLSVVITTCADAAAAVRCVQAVLRHMSGQGEVVVVDNRPHGSTVRAALEDAFDKDSAVRYVAECRPGLACARNAGLRAATGDVVAFIDDDVIVDGSWMPSIVETFTDNPSASCVTGPILPLEFETPAQVLVEQFASFSKGFERRSYGARLGSAQAPLFPYAAGHFGSGANMAFRTEAIRDLGGFDVALGAGTIARGGEDLDISVRLIRAGGNIVYEPRSIVWHRHPLADDAILRQAFSYGVGLGAMLGKQLLVGPDRRRLVSLVPAGLQYLLSGSSRKNAGKPAEFPRRLTVLERWGMVFGPFAYLRSYAHARRTVVGALPEVAPTRVEHIWSGQLDLERLVLPTEPPRRAGGRYFDQARLLIRLAGAPIGFVQVPIVNGVLNRDEVVAVAEERFSDVLSKLRSAPAAPVAPSDASVTVVLCTRNRPDGVRRCLTSLRQLAHENLEIIVVDNAPDDDRTQKILAEFAAGPGRLRYVREPGPGLSRARNRGLLEAGGEFIAFTDDDVRVDPLWIAALLRGFDRRADVGCVTGLVASSSLEHPAERFFDERVWWSSSCEQRLYDISHGPSGSKLHPYAAGVFGTGANMAFRTDELRAIGGFDESLGAGSPTSGGEDLDIYVRLLRSGGALSYEPQALVWHDHRVDSADLQAQMYGYGKGLAAYLCKYLMSRCSRRDVAGRIVVGALHFLVLGRRSRAAGQRAALGAGLQRAELRGMLAGAPAYLRARRTQSRDHITAVAPR